MDMSMMVVCGLVGFVIGGACFLFLEYKSNASVIITFAKSEIAKINKKFEDVMAAIKK